MKDAIYAAYFTGLLGNSVAIFHFSGGRIVGADIGGGLYDGQYFQSTSEEISGEIKLKIPSNTLSIAGAMPLEGLTEITVPIRLPAAPQPQEIFRIETPIGAINARFVILREL